MVSFTDYAPFVAVFLLAYLVAATRPEPIDCCERWMEYEEKKQNLSWVKDMEKEIPCPCSVKEVLSINRAAAASESGIVWTAEHSKLREYSYFFKLERYHPGAIQCYRSPYKNKHGQQCCYDSDLALITNGPGGGTADKGLAALDVFSFLYSAIMSPIFSAPHKQLDVYPFLDCGGSSGWRAYKKYRPISNGRNCRENFVGSTEKNLPIDERNELSFQDFNRRHLFPDSIKVSDVKFCNWQPPESVESLDPQSL